MTKRPLPRFTTTVALTVELSASDEDDALKRLAVIEDFVTARLGKTTFARLAGKPSILHIESQEPSLS